MDYLVRIEAGVVVRNVETNGDALNVAVSEIGKKLNSSNLKYVDIKTKTEDGKKSKVEIVAGTALVGLFLDMKVFDAESKEHAVRISKSVIGKVLRNIPLKECMCKHIERESAGAEEKAGKS